MKLGKMSVTVACMLALGSTVACVGEEEGTVDGALAPASLEPQASITYNGFTLDAKQPLLRQSTIFNVTSIFYKGQMVVSGGSGTQKQGVCLLRQYNAAPVGSPPSLVSCSSVTDCTAAGVTAPTGGSVYCTNINNTGSKTCFVRPGTAANWCAGSPASGVAVGNGTYTTPEQLAGIIGMSPPGVFVSYACVAGCTASDPSVSSAAGYY